MLNFDSLENLLSQGRVLADLSQNGNDCIALAIEIEHRRYFIKYASQLAGRDALKRAIVLHQSVQDPLIWPLLQHLETQTHTVLIYCWCEGKSLYQPAPERDQADSRLNQFRKLPLAQRLDFLTQIYKAHHKIATAGLIMVDFYDGSFLFDADQNQIHLIDLDEYRTGPFVLAAERLPGSQRFMAPEEFQQGSLIDQLTNVFALGACAREFLAPEIQDKSLSGQLQVLIQQACHPDRDSRFHSVADFVKDWQKASSS